MPVADAIVERDRRRLRALGVVRDRAPVIPGRPRDVEPVTIDGLDGAWRVDPDQIARPFRGRVALLSPLDRLVFDRERMTALFDFDYQLEMYKPAAKRRWGYFALPVLCGDELIGKVDATVDRKRGVLRVDAVHEDGAWTASVRDEVHHEIDGLAEWLDLGLDLR